MALTPLYKATQLQVAGGASPVALESLTLQSGDTATFSKSSRSSSAGYSLIADNSGLKVSSNSHDIYYFAGAPLASGQDQVDLQMDIAVSEYGQYSCAGFTLGDADDGNNFLEVLTWVGSGVPTSQVHATNHVSGATSEIGGSDPSYSYPPNCDFPTGSISTAGVLTLNSAPTNALQVGDLIATGSGVPAASYVASLISSTSAQLAASPSAAVSTTFQHLRVLTMLVQVRGTAGAYTLNVSLGPKGGALTPLLSGASVPSLVMIGRRIGLRQTYYGTNAQSAVYGPHIMNFASSVYSAGEADAAPTVVPTATSGTLAVTPAQATGGTAPYSYQLQRATVTSGTPGAYANVGTAQSTSGAPAAINDSGLTVGSTYSYQTVVTDSSGTPQTVTSPATQFQVPAPSFDLATSPASVVLAQGQSLSIAVSAQPIAGYTGAPALSCPTLPQGVTASFSPSTLSSSGGWSSTLTLTAAGNAAASVSALSVQASDGTITQAVPIVAYVAAPIGPFSTTTSVQSGDMLLLQRGGSTYWIAESAVISYINSGGT